MIVLTKFSLVTLLAAIVVIVSAAPASAHGVSGVQPSNYETRVLSVSPENRGLRLRPVDLGNSLELSNTTSGVVDVLGYDGEPYLRIGPRGVFENQRSPAVYLNRSRSLSPESPPPRFDSEGEPDWRQVSSGRSVRWHDHRAHWMGNEDPPVVQRNPGAPHVIQRFTIQLRVAGTPTVARGDIRWVPGPSPWPWLVGALLIALIVLGASRTRAWGVVLGTVTVGLVAFEIIHVAGLFGATSASVPSTLWASGFSISGIILGAVAVTWAVRRGSFAAVPMILFAGLVIGFAGGLADLTVFWRSQIPTTFSAGTARLLIMGVLGLGAGLIASAALRLAPSRSGRTSITTPGTAPTP